MIVLNFAAPLTDLNKQQLQALTGELVERTYTMRLQTDTDEPIQAQVRRLFDQLPLHPGMGPVALIPPGQSTHTAVVLVALLGRTGSLPLILRTRPLMYSVPPRSEIVELLDLRTLADSFSPPAED